MFRIAGVPRHGSHISPAVLALAHVIASAARPWTEQALCAQADPDAFFSESTRQIEMARAICQRCPVRQSCLSQALDGREEFGVWGGLDGDERQRLLRRARRAPGSPAA
ncbi:MAG TPA: WhiB family transcriptional regulator [Streptosporangiaceae bacterium]